jgi:hypothetical protein
MHIGHARAEWLIEVFRLTTGNARRMMLIRSNHGSVNGVGNMTIHLERMVADVPLGRAGKFGSMTVEVERFNAAVHDHVYMYGLRQILNDAMADKTDDDGAPLSDEDIVAKAQKRLDTLYSGELRTRRESAEPADPTEREAWRMAREKIEKGFRLLGIWPAKGRDKFDAAVVERCKMLDREPMTTEEYIIAYLEKNPGVRVAAAKVVRERNRADAGEMV